MTILSDRYARIFLLSHMRAYTSLAGHILGSHPQINGYYEMHLSYEDVSALDRQLELFQQGDALKPGSRYLFDKLLHNDYVLKPERLGLAELKFLVSLALYPASNSVQFSLQSINVASAFVGNVGHFDIKATMRR